MLGTALPSSPDAPLRLLCLGAHPDDIEIGCGGTLLRLLRSYPRVAVYWFVLSGNNERRREAIQSATHLLAGVKEKTITVKNFRDGYFPFDGAAIKAFFEEIKQACAPDVIFTHYREDRHQDHRLVSDLTWNTFRDHLVLEYEIPKFDGDLGSPNAYVALDAGLCQQKIQHLTAHFASQHAKRWYTAETFQALLRLRGIECGADYAEAFHARKLKLFETSGAQAATAGVAETAALTSAVLSPQ